MGLGECMSRLDESKAISQLSKMNSTSCSYNSTSRGQTCSSDEGELDELFIQLGESDEGSFDDIIKGELIESLLNSTSRNVKKVR